MNGRDEIAVEREDNGWNLLIWKSRDAWRRIRDKAEGLTIVLRCVIGYRPTNMKISLADADNEANVGTRPSLVTISPWFSQK